MDAEWNIIYDKLDKCVESGAKIVLSRLAIGDLATQYFADRDIFCAGRVSPSCLSLTFKHSMLQLTARFGSESSALCTVLSYRLQFSAISKCITACVSE